MGGGPPRRTLKDIELTLGCAVLSRLVLYCIGLECMSFNGLSCLVLVWRGLCWIVLSCRVLPYHITSRDVLYCRVLSCFAICYLVLS